MDGQPFSGYVNHATEQVALWILNDGKEFVRGDVVRAAQQGVDAFRAYMLRALRCAGRTSGGWYVRRDLSINELDMIDWQHICRDVLVMAGLADE